jgi:DegV family protein with EDD domain
MKIAISAESTIDLPSELLKQYDIETVPFTLTMGEESGLDGVVTPDELFAYTDKTGKLARTSAVNEFQFDEHFGKLLKDHEAVIHLSLSSEMSSAYHNACLAAKKLKNVFVIDSRSLSTGIALLAIYARKLATKGLKPQEIVEAVEKRIPFDQASFSLESVNYLYKGGRCSTLAMLGANILRLKPEIYVRNGKMGAGKKYHGKMEVAVMHYVEDTLAMFKNPDLEEVFITYSTVPDGLIDQIKARLTKRGFKHIMVTRAGGTISCHCGPHCLGILYINDGPHPVA